MIDLKITLPEHFLEEEERCGYIVSHKMKEVWAVELDLLNEFMRVCDKNDITYFVDAGTILGAVRHGGYIPWDDDIDVMMMRDQYERLCELGTEEFNHPYFFQTEYTDKGTLRGHAQLRNSETTGILNSEFRLKRKFNQGIFLDIFPIDSVPDDEKKFDRQLREAMKYKSRASRLAALTDLYVATNNCTVKSVIKSGLHILLKRFPEKYIDYDKLYKRYEEICSKYSGKNTERVAKYFMLPMNKARRVWLRKDLESIVYMPFEMLEVPVPSGYEGILNRFYGNWREFVRGNATHGEVWFDVDVTYTTYLREKC